VVQVERQISDRALWRLLPALHCSQTTRKARAGIRCHPWAPDLGCKLDHPGRVARPDPGAGIRGGDDLLAKAAISGSLRQLHNDGLGVGKGFRVPRYDIQRHLEQIRNSRSIGEEPGLDLTDGDPEAHIHGRRRHEARYELRSTFRIVVQIANHEPISEAGRAVVASERVSQKFLVDVLKCPLWDIRATLRMRNGMSSRLFCRMPNREAVPGQPLSER
jgi:hypothetical protein